MSEPRDDRADFELMKRDAAQRMAADEGLMARALAVSVEADRYAYGYQWTWLGVPIIQMPQDIVATQEAVWTARPEVIVETGIARGGSMILLASILELLGGGKVIGVDVDIRPHNRDSIENHPLGRRVTMIEGSSTDGGTVERVRAEVGDASRVMVILDSDHTHEHVLAELRAYAPMVTSGQYLIVADTAVELIPAQGHRPRPWGPGNNPMTALDAYLAEDDRFERDDHLNAKLLITSSPGGYLRCR